MLNGLFDIYNRLEYLTENGYILPNLKKLVSWEDFCSELEFIYDHERKSNAGRRPFDVVMMFKILILQSLYNLSDDETECQIMDRLKTKNFRPHLQRKGCKGHQLTSWEKQGNRTKAKVRSRIEHVFGVIHQRAGDVILRTIGIAMAKESKS